MAEALAAFSVAANIVAFVDFGTKVFSAGYRLQKSADGSLDTNETHEQITIDLAKVIHDLERSIGSSSTHRQLTSNELGLLDLAKQCKAAATKFLAGLDKLKVQGKHGRWNTFKAALKTVWKESEIENMQMSIERLKQQLIVRILASFRDQMHGLESTQASISDHVERIDGNTQGVGEKFLSFIKEARTWKADIIYAIHEDKASAGDRGLIGNGPHQSERVTSLQSKLLRRLHFSDMEDRHNRISKAHEATFQWLYQDPEESVAPWSSFTNWLSSDSNLYWITGKAGSGKSTLMKYVYSDQRTFDGLEEWCNGVTLRTAAFFFWNSGSEMQMSQLGLLRSLFYQILSKYPNLIPVVFPARSESSLLFGDDPQPWTLAELRQGFKLLAAESLVDNKFCFFIDGLDEFDGDPMNLISLLKDVNSSPNIKICVSSRPWVEFEDAFKDRSSLRVQDLTYRDIQDYVSSHFLGHAGFAELERREPEYASQLIEDIVRKASGVFLWVNLVVHSLLAGFGNADRVSDLKRRLDFLPPDLENLYQKMLKSLDPFYLEHASQLFRLVRASPSPLSLLSLSFADEDEEYVFKCKVQPLTKEERILRANLTKRRLNSRCKGLLEVAPGPDPPSSAETSDGGNSALPGNDDRAIEKPENTIADHTVQYLHRTVKDYLESPKVWKMLLDACQSLFDPQLALLRSSVLQLKGLHPHSLSHDIFWTAIKRCIICAKTIDKLGPSPELVRILDELNIAATELTSHPGSDGTSFTRYYGKQCRPEIIEDLIFHEFYGTRPQITWAKSTKAEMPNYDSRDIWQPHWTRTLSGFRDSSGSSFLSLAIKTNLGCYVEAKLSNKCLIAQTFGVWPALLDAVIPDWGSINFFGTELTPNLDMINILLDKGADPNWCYNGITVWNLALRSAVSPGTKYRFGFSEGRNARVSTAWLQVMNAFLQHGADPAMIDSTTFDAIESAGSYPGCKETAVHAMDLLNTYKRQTKIWSWPWSRA